MDLSRLYGCLAERPARQLQFVTQRGALEAVTFMQLRERVDVFVSRLSECGLRPGDLVGILGPNSPEWIAADLALQRMGCVSVALPVEGRGTKADTEALVALTIAGSGDQGIDGGLSNLLTEGAFDFLVFTTSAATWQFEDAHSHRN
mgnify:CR=1 FL=1